MDGLLFASWMGAMDVNLVYKCCNRYLDRFGLIFVIIITISKHAVALRCPKESRANLA